MTMRLPFASDTAAGRQNRFQNLQIQALLLYSSRSARTLDEP